MDLRTEYWNMLLVHPLESGLRFLASDLGLGAGLAIILFTIAIRVVLLPLTLQQIKSQKAMAQLQPEIKAIQKKYGSDREKVSQETMALYKQYGVNPAASCLPLALQMPVLFALYAALNNLGRDDPVFQAPWLWLSSLHTPDAFHIVGLSFALPGVLPIVAAVTQWVQQRMMTQPTDDPQQRAQNQMMQFMPLMMLYFGLVVSSGLALYWVTTNLLGIGQQYFSTGWGSLPQAFASLNRFRGGTPLQSGGAGPARGRAPGTGRRDGSAGGRDTARSGHRDGGRDRAGRGEGGGTEGGGGAGGRQKREGRRASGKR